MARATYIRRDDDDDVLFVLDQHTELDLYSATLLKQQSVVRHVAPFWQITLFEANQSLILIFNVACLGDTTRTNFIVLDLILTGLEFTIYSTKSRNTNHYITVPFIMSGFYVGKTGRILCGSQRVQGSARWKQNQYINYWW